MSQVPMVECTLVGRHADAEAVVEALQDANVLHVTAIPVPPNAEDLLPGAAPAPTAGEDTRTDFAQLEHRLDALQSVAPAPARLQIRDLTYDQVSERIDALIEARAALQLRVTQLDAQRDMLVPWGDFDPDDLAAIESAGLRLAFVQMTEDEWLSLGGGVSYALASVRDGLRHVVVFDPPQELPGNTVDLPRASLNKILADLEVTEQGLRETQRELGRFAHYAPLIAKRIESLQDRMAVLSALDGAVSAGPIFALQGFVPREQVVDLQKALAPFACALQVKDAVPGDERVPVKLKNNALVRGFESIVAAFSGIRYGEKDFTWAVGVLFLTFGSLCLLDAGYGFMLGVLGIVLYMRGSKAMGMVFTLTGIASVVIGLMAGQFFGLIVGQTVMRDSRPLLTLSSEPYHAFLFSLFVGMIVLPFGYCMAIWQRGFKTDATGALLLSLAAIAGVYAHMAAEWLHTVLGGGVPPSPELLAAAKLWGHRAMLTLIALAVLAWIAYPGPVFGPKARIGNILWTLYSGPTGFVQDVLSHMRLFGIALSGGIMALVINEMAARFSLPVTALFALVGHFFVFLLSLLSLYIHTNRLIFLEWGSKCIDGGSNFYAPLRRSSI